MRYLYSFLLPFLALFGKEGLYYSHIELPGQSIHHLEVDPELYEMRPVRALDNGLGREEVLSLVARYQADAGVNAGFFSIGGTYDGRTTGALKIQEWIALPFKPRGCLGWNAREQHPYIDRLLTELKLLTPLGEFPLDGLNSPRNAGQAILYTPVYHRTTLTNQEGEEAVVVDGVIQAVQKKGSTKIPEAGWVLSMHRDHSLYGKLEPGMPLSYELHALPQFDKETSWDDLDYIVGGTPVLLSHGSTPDFTEERTIPTFLSLRHARTALGILPNGHWLFVVVDKNEQAEGMTMKELTDWMLSHQCVEALNFDGGGSATMIFEGQLKNSPRGDEEEARGKMVARRVSDAILIFSKQ